MEKRSSGVESIRPVSEGEAFVQKWMIVKDIQAFAMGTLESKDLFLASPEIREKLDTEQGKKALTDWLKAFEPAMTLLNRFHIESQAGIPFNAADWRLVDRTVTKILDMLIERLLEIEDGVVDSKNK